MEAGPDASVRDLVGKQRQVGPPVGYAGCRRAARRDLGDGPALRAPTTWSLPRVLQLGSRGPPGTNMTTSGRRNLLKVQLTGRFVSVRVRVPRCCGKASWPNMWLAAEASKAARPLFTWDGKICSAKSNRSRHRDRKKGISDFVQKFVSHRHILPLARPNFSVITLGRHIMQDPRGNHPARHHATFRGGVVILLRGEPRLIRPPR